MSDGASSPLFGSVPVPSLAARPFRPGEVPTFLNVTLDRPRLETALVGARAGKVPLELWVRLSIDATRHLETAAEASGLSVPALTKVLDVARPEGVELAVGRELLAWGRLIDSGDDELVELASELELELAISHEEVGAWHRAANAARLELSEWAALMLARAPGGALRWEAAAARAFRGLGEWVYAAALSAVARRSALAHTQA